MFNTCFRVVTTNLRKSNALRPLPLPFASSYLPFHKQQIGSFDASKY